MWKSDNVLASIWLVCSWLFPLWRRNRKSWLLPAGQTARIIEKSRMFRLFCRAISRNSARAGNLVSSAGKRGFAHHDLGIGDDQSLCHFSFSPFSVYSTDASLTRSAVGRGLVPKSALEEIHGQGRDFRAD